MAPGGSAAARFPGIASVFVLIVTAFSLVHVFRLNVLLVGRPSSPGGADNRAPHASARVGLQPRRPKPSYVEHTPVVPVETAPSSGAAVGTGADRITPEAATATPSAGSAATATPSAESVGPGTTSPAPGGAPKPGAGQGFVDGFPRDQFVFAADEAEIRARDCPNRRPFHTLLTTQDRIYMQWQTYSAYFHWSRAQRADWCTDMTAITRLLAAPGGRPDALMALMPTFVVDQLGSDKTRGFQVPNHPRVVSKWYKGPLADVQPTGPSPALMHRDMLKAITQDWFDLSVQLKRDADADAVFGWVLEMWGYTIVCARHGIQHEVWQQFMIEPASTWHQNVTAENPYIYHYTFGLEYTFDGLPMVGQVGEWSLDKRKYSAGFLPAPLNPPPECAHEAAHLLTRLFNEASAASPPWLAKAPPRSMDTTRQERPPPLDRSQGIVKSIMGSGPWAIVRPEYAGHAPNAIFFYDHGRVFTPLGSATWAPAGAGADAIRFRFCTEDTLVLEKGADGVPVLRGKTYELRKKEHPPNLTPDAPASMWESATAKHVIGSGPWSWGGVPTVVFMDKGQLHTPWAPGTWTVKEGANLTVVAEFLGTKCTIEFLPCGRFRSVRQSDGDVVHGWIQISEPVRFKCRDRSMLKT